MEYLYHTTETRPLYVMCYSIVANADIKVLA
jgi:hypothetical protein